MVVEGPSPRWFCAALALGLVSRLALFHSEPILETDYYRYLWDGAVLSEGANPYRPVPAHVLELEGPLTALARDSGEVVGRINHPQLRTVYPPVAQVFFAAAHPIKPWSLLAWRLVLLVADGATMILFLRVLRAAGRPSSWALIYWLHPVVLRETFNSGHMDVILLPSLLGALLAANRGRTFSASLFLALATGTKLWPVLLIPAFLRASDSSWCRCVAATVAFVIAVGIIHSSVLAAGFDHASGFTAYASRWEMNDGPYLLLIEAGKMLARITRAQFAPRTFATAVAALAILSVVLLAGLGKAAGIVGLSGRVLAIIGALFILSPTQFPWYSIWFVPFLAVVPSRGLLLYAVTMPLYNVRFRFEELSQVSLFDNVIVWSEHAPVLALLAFEAFQYLHDNSLRKRSAGSESGHADPRGGGA